LVASLKSAARLTGGIVLTLIGVAGLVLPILPGWLFLIPGLMILADYFPPVHRLLQWAKKKAGGFGVGGERRPPPESPTSSSGSGS